MKEVALADAQLPALVAEVEATGETILLTRDGKPAAALAPAPQGKLGHEERAAVVRGLVEALDRMSREHPRTAEPLSWEELKADMYPEDRYG